MKKWVIGSLIGAIIVFSWQGASWTVLGIHDSAMKYTPAQKEIMNVLSANLTEDGLYVMPSAPTKKEQQDMMKALEGKPMASVVYHKEAKMDMTMPMIRGFLVDLFLVISLIYILTRGGVPIARRVFSGSVALGLFLWLANDYMNHVWFQLPWSMIQGNLIDDVVAWSLCGLWLAWWLNRSKK